MPTFLKILIGVGVVFGLLAASCAGLATYAAGESKALTADATVFAQTHDQYGCESAAFDKVESCGGVVCLVKAATWHSICLGEATPNSGYCDGVPHPRDTPASESWYADACQRVQMPDDDNCRAILGATQALCHNAAWRARTGGVNVSVNTATAQ